MYPKEIVEEELRCLQLWMTQSPKQEELSSSDKRIRIAFGGNRTGKSVFLAQEICMFVFGSHKFAESHQLQTPVEVWVCCPSYDVQKDTIQKKLEMMIPRHRILDVTYIKKDVWGTIKLDNGSAITFKSYDQGRTKFQGAGKRAIFFDEEPPYDVWEEATMRVEAGQRLDVLLAMTPVNGMSWSYFKLFQATDNPDIFYRVLTWDDNPWLTDQQKLELTRGLTEEALQMRRDGKFMQMVGLVCPWWRRDIHLKDDIERKTSWNIYRIIDFGWSSSKTCVLWIGVDSYDRVYVFDGIYENYLDDEELAKLIKAKEKDFHVTKSWADNTPDRINVLRKCGVYCEPVKKVGDESGWDVTRSEALAKVGKIDPITNKSRLIVSSKLTYMNKERGTSSNWFCEEIESLRWAEKRTGMGSKTSTQKWNHDSNNKESHYDAIDCLSYFTIMSGRKNTKFRAREGIVVSPEEDEIIRRPKSKFTPRNPLTGY